MTNGPSEPKTSGRGQKFKLGSLTLLLVGAFAAWNLSSWPTRLRYPGEIVQVEGMRLAEMQHLIRGVPVYAPATPERFDAMIYGPLYYLFGAQLINPEKPAYFPLRLLCLFATLGCAAGVALLAFWLSRSYFAAALAPLLFLSYGFVSLHGVSARSDMMAVFLVYAGFLVAYRFIAGRHLLWAAPIMLVGLFYKQQFVAAPAAVFIFLVLDKRYRLAAQFAGLMALGGLSLLALFQYVIFARQDFFLHFVNYNLVPFTWNRFGYGALLWAVVFGVPSLLGLEFVRRHPDKLVLCYLACAVPLALFSLGKEGSGTNYFLELTLILAPLVAGLVAESTGDRMRAVEVVCLVGVSLLIGAKLGSLVPQPEDFARDRAVQDYLRQNFAPGVLATSMSTGDLVRAGLETPISDLYQYTWLVCQGKIPAHELIGQFEKRRFGVILLGVDLYDEKDAHRSNEICMTESLHQTILQGYQLAATLEMPWPEQADHPTRMYVWVPRRKSEVSGPPATQ
jgi:hypothetical protein